MTSVRSALLISRSVWMASARLSPSIERCASLISRSYWNHSDSVVTTTMPMTTAAPSTNIMLLGFMIIDSDRFTVTFIRLNSIEFSTIGGTPLIIHKCVAPGRCRTVMGVQ